eukprot:CAMPEP_0177657268 /NCGR_PEP_ID=MMETSP0447-20121125/16085_1 /TAXON_ID=0 /ORGANISM="Stygamoeba regulata, Strain BSH-02190019" /LENGTH=205 /DNA_ID=CAMNT_0019161593 /DNA_START=80 /DNA_END=697 /DNA_ORIENTATION=-
MASGEGDGVTYEWQIKDSLGAKVGRIFSSKKRIKAVLMGVGADGRTTLLQRLLTHTMTEPERTKSLTTETFTWKKHDVICDDLAGKESVRSLWSHHVIGTHVFVWTVDGSKKDLLEESRKALHGLIKENSIVQQPLLVLVTKSDLDGVMTAEEVAKELKLKNLGLKNVHCQNVSSRTGQGVKEALDWMVEAVKGNGYVCASEKGL